MPKETAMPISPRAERLRHAIYTQLAEHGTLQTRDALAAELGLTSAEYKLALAELADAHHVVLDGGEVVLAHPFATRSFRFSVMGPRTLWWGGCAWDAFAIPHLVRGSPAVLVATTCPACATAHAWTVTNEAPPAGDQLAHFLVPTAQIWPDAAHACANQQIFCSEQCIAEWLERTGNTRGSVLSLTTLWRLAAHWYEGRLGTPYERREPTQAADYFRSVGLSGGFWGLGAGAEG
ncbi:organomercurial lyase [Microterricola pindariensis]|nr:organomercurial lyase [Microterricola pindariensis]